MNKEEIETKLKNLTYITLVGFIVLIILVAGLYFKGSTTATGTNSGNNSSDSSYDTSRLTLLDKNRTEALIKSKNTEIVYIGRSGCGVCQNYLPKLNTVIDKLDIKVNYLSLDVSNWKTEYEDIFDVLDIETTITDSSGEKHEGTYGELLKKFGFTPITVIIKDGKMVDGFVGSRDTSYIEEFFNKYL